MHKIVTRVETPIFTQKHDRKLGIYKEIEISSVLRNGDSNWPLLEVFRIVIFWEQCSHSCSLIMCCVSFPSMLCSRISVGRKARNEHSFAGRFNSVSVSGRTASGWNVGSLFLCEIFYCFLLDPVAGCQMSSTIVLSRNATL